MAQGKVKMLRPPHFWAGAKPGVQEDQRYGRYTKPQVRAMKNGTYDWAVHTMRPVKGS